MLALIVCICTPSLGKTEAGMEDSFPFDRRFVLNPRDIRAIGDPFVLRTEHPDGDPDYIVFATGGPAGFLYWASDDLIRFRRGVAMKKLDWASGDYWAPEVYPWQGKYAMLFTVRWKETGSLRIGLALSEKPEGPYTDALGGPLFDFGYAAIDATLITDEGGTPYLIYARDCSENLVQERHESHLYGVQLTDDLTATVGEPVLLTQPDQAWETLSGDTRWNEGPSVVRHDGRYYLFYSANFFASREYGIGVAVADTPLGPYRKQANNPILRWSGTEDAVQVSGPGHNAFFTAGDELFASYHTHTFPDRPSGNRQLCIDRAGFHHDGTAYINGPTLAPQLRPLTEIGCVNHMRTAACTGDPLGLLCDGDICQAASSRAYAWSETSPAVFAWDTPVRADLLLLYPALGERISGTVAVNGTALSFFFTPETPGESLRIPMEARSISRLELFLDAGALGEAILLGPDD